MTSPGNAGNADEQVYYSSSINHKNSHVFCQTRRAMAATEMDDEVPGATRLVSNELIEGMRADAHLLREF